MVTQDCVSLEDKVKVTIEWPDKVIRTYTLSAPTGHFVLEAKHPTFAEYFTIKNLDIKDK